jgi:c-di-GMP-binding flagellar brake protein YcgR
MFPLQVDLTAFWKEDTNSPMENILFISILAAVVIVIIVVTKTRGRLPATTTAGNAAVTGLFSRFKTHRLARNAGLKREQIKMLDFVFKNDQVVDPEKSLNTPSLLDRHFRHAYREIEQSNDSEAETQSRLSLLFSTRSTLEHSVGDSFTSTAQLKDDTTLVISGGRDKYTVQVVSANSEHLVVECPKNALGTPIKFQRGNKLTVLIFTMSNKSFSFETRVIGNSSKYGSNTLLLAHSDQIKSLSQRRYRRKQTVIPCNIFIVFVEGSGKKQRLIVDKRRLTGNIADISVGGCSVNTKASIQVGSRLKIEFTQGDASVAALGQVLRTNRSGIVTVIHMKFLRVTRKSMNIINAFVYEYAYG